MEAIEFVHTGWLHKQSRYRKKWRRRFVVLTKHHIMTFGSEELVDTPTELLAIKHCKAVTAVKEAASVPFSFSVSYEGKEFNFYCENEEERQKWVKLIEKGMESPYLWTERKYTEDTSDEES